jgi:hypothetical protein
VLSVAARQAVLFAAITVALSATADARTGRARAPATGPVSYLITGPSGHPIPGKLTIEGVRPTRTPKLGPRYGRRIGADVVSFNRVFSTTGRGWLALPAGSYDVTVSRGPEWTVHRQRIRVGDDAVGIEARLTRAVDTTGWLATDLHVHAVRSTDSVVPMKARLQQMIADGIEMLASTDHNTVSDYGPAIDALGARHLIGSARGYELTTKKWGHLGAFPLPARLANKKRGAVLSRGRTGADYIARIREAEPASIVIAFHPHSRTSSYLRDGGLRRGRDRARPGFSWDFDALEILNGYNKYNFGSAIRRNLAAWFDLLDHGHLVAAVGGSDSHALRAIGGQGGYPRTYVFVGDDRPDAATPAAVVRGIAGRRAIATTGPFVTAEVAGRGIGQLAPAPGGRATVRVRVQAAPWVPTDRLTIYVDGRVRRRIPIPAGRAPLRIDRAIELEVGRDAYVVVRVDGDGDLMPVAGERDHAIPSIAIANPIFLDVDGNRRFDPAKPHGHR